MRSKSRRGPSAIATVRSGGSALSRAGAGAGSMTATEAPAPSACFSAAASDKPAAPPPAMATSKTGMESVKLRGSPEARIVGRMGRRRNPTASSGRDRGHLGGGWPLPVDRLDL